MKALSYAGVSRQYSTFPTISMPKLLSRKRETGFGNLPKPSLYVVFFLVQYPRD